MGDPLARMPINRRAKFDAASFILGEEIRNRTNTQNYKQVRPSSGTAVYPQMPTASIANRRQSPLLSAEGTGVYQQYLPPSADSSDIGLLGEQSSQNGRFHAQDDHEPPGKI